MLLRFSVSNHRSIRERAELSLMAVDEDRPAARFAPSLGQSVLAVAGIYGPNASGKSNLLDALAWLSSAVRNSLRVWDGGIPREPFRFANASTQPSTFEIEFLIEGVRYWYVLEVTDTQVEFEALYNYPERRRRTLFEREGTEFLPRRGLENAVGIRELLTPTTLALSAGLRFPKNEFDSLRRAFRFESIFPPARRRRGWSRGSFRRYSGIESLFLMEGSDLTPDDSTRLSEDRAAAVQLMQFADLGISDIQVADPDEDPATGAPIASARPRLQLVHSAGEEKLPFDLTDESDGTQTWFRLAGSAMSVLQQGDLLLLDEIDASLHPRLSAHLVQMFQSPEINPRGAQLVFTSHDTSLLDHLNRDEVWLAEKDETAATSLTALAEYGGQKVRRSVNLQRAYLQGRFGAVPDLDQEVVRHAIGLITGAPDAAK
jgi:AAA15 family ATPase/GTPase